DGRLPSGPTLLRRLKAEPETAALPVVVLDADGGEWDYEAEARLPAATGATALAAVARALARARRAEARLKTLARQWRSTFDAIRDGIALLDLSGRVLRCNFALATLAGRSPAEMIGGDASGALGD